MRTIFPFALHFLILVRVPIFRFLSMLLLRVANFTLEEVYRCWEYNDGENVHRISSVKISPAFFDIPSQSLLFPQACIDVSSKNHQQFINETSMEHRCFRNYHIEKIKDFIEIINASPKVHLCRSVVVAARLRSLRTNDPLNKDIPGPSRMK